MKFSINLSKREIETLKTMLLDASFTADLQVTSPFGFRDREKRRSRARRYSDLRGRMKMHLDLLERGSEELKRRVVAPEDGFRSTRGRRARS